VNLLDPADNLPRKARFTFPVALLVLALAAVLGVVLATHQNSLQVLGVAVVNKLGGVKVADPVHLTKVSVAAVLIQSESEARVVSLFETAPVQPVLDFVAVLQRRAMPVVQKPAAAVLVVNGVVQLRDNSRTDLVATLGRVKIPALHMKANAAVDAIILVVVPDAGPNPPVVVGFDRVNVELRQDGVDGVLGSGKHGVGVYK